MRRGEQSHAQSGCAINAFQHRASRAFAVGASDVDEPESFLRIAGERGKFARGLQSEICTEQIQAVEKLDGFGVGHVRGKDKGSSLNDERDVVFCSVRRFDFCRTFPAIVIMAIAAHTINHVTLF